MRTKTSNASDEKHIIVQKRFDLWEESENSLWLRNLWDLVAGAALGINHGSTRGRESKRRLFAAACLFACFATDNIQLGWVTRHLGAATDSCHLTTGFDVDNIWRISYIYNIPLIVKSYRKKMLKRLTFSRLLRCTTWAINTMDIILAIC